jgi:hypothetical protein
MKYLIINRKNFGFELQIGSWFLVLLWNIVVQNLELIVKYARYWERNSNKRGKAWKNL